MTSILKRILFLLLIFASCFGCEKENHKDADLLKAKWILTYIQDTNTNVFTQYPSDAAKTISIEFSNTSDDISFWGICNRGSGTYTYSSVTGEIKVTDLITTLIGCKYVEWEAYTVQNLYYASNYKINGNDLVIYSNGEYNLYLTKD